MTDLAAWEAIRDAIAAISLTTAQRGSREDVFTHHAGAFVELLTAPDRSFTLKVAQGPNPSTRTCTREAVFELLIAYDDTDGSDARILADATLVEQALWGLGGDFDPITELFVSSDFYSNQTHVSRAFTASWQEG